MLNVWKYGHLCENLTFIGYLCEICSMFKKYGHLCENVTFIGYLCEIRWSVCSLWSLVWKYAEVCAVLVSDGHYTESDNSSVSDKKRETDCPGFKSWVAWVLESEVGLNFYTMLNEARWKETRPYGARLAFGSMLDVLLRARLPLQWNVRCACSTRVSNKRRRETRVIMACLTLGPSL
jgi:hypothetical protein